MLHEHLETSDCIVVGHVVGGVGILVDALDHGGFRVELQAYGKGLVGAFHGLDDVDSIGWRNARHFQRGRCHTAHSLMMPGRNPGDRVHTGNLIQQGIFR